MKNTRIVIIIYNEGNEGGEPMKVIKTFRSLSERSSKDHLFNSAMLCMEPNFII